MQNLQLHKYSCIHLTRVRVNSFEKQFLYPGQVLKVDFEREDDDDDCLKCRGRWIYELKLLQDQGRMTKRKIDARTGETLWVGTRPLRHDGRHP